MKYIIQKLDGKDIGYTDQTEFIVEVGKDKKGSYKRVYTVVGNLTKAVMWYRGINIGNGYKKRLRAPSMNKPILARAFS